MSQLDEVVVPLDEICLVNWYDLKGWKEAYQDNIYILGGAAGEHDLNSEGPVNFGHESHEECTEP